jgi:formylglycine-generating enzyme required for sulfatase activity
VATSKADANGIYDLLGNVSEWVEETVYDDSKGLSAGGSVRDNHVRIAEVPREPHSATERLRNNGFRIVMAVK